MTIIYVIKYFAASCLCSASTVQLLTAESLISCPDLCLHQFMDRLQLLLMPAKHQPDLIYLRHVPQRRIHLFTFIQGLCLALLWVLKSTVAAIVFPVMVRLAAVTDKNKRRRAQC